MSLSNPRQVNPASKFIEWSGSKGVFYYYDKTTQQDVIYSEVLYIIPLDKLTTIKGYHDASKSGIYSNEIRNITKDKLTVKSFKGGLIASGLYSDIKGKLEGGKFGNSIYCALITNKGKDLELINLQIHGSSLGSFIDAKINVDNGNVISLSPSTEELQKGTTIYFAPGIKKHEKRKDVLDKCIQMDKDLQEYLNGYLKEPVAVQEEITEAQTENLPDTEPDDLPF